MTSNWLIIDQTEKEKENHPGLNFFHLYGDCKSEVEVLAFSVQSIYINCGKSNNYSNSMDKL